MPCTQCHDQNVFERLWFMTTRGQKTEPRDSMILYTLSEDNTDARCTFCAQLRAFLRASGDDLKLKGSSGRIRLRCYISDGGVVSFALESRDELRELHLMSEEYASISQAGTKVVDLALAKSWLDECCSGHPRTCGRVVKEKSVTLKCIDCKSGNVCVLPSDSPYACLSYVWGLTVAAQNQATPIKKMPKTVRDATFVVLGLGLRYLWVDRYCIDQENAAELHHLVSNMDQIYEGATVTIIAAAGAGPHDGLPGIQGTPRPISRAVALENRSYAVFENPRGEIRESVWNTRGWTYQEMLLSRRRLVFTPSQMYFQCGYMQCIERVKAHFTAHTGSTDIVQGLPRVTQGLPWLLDTSSTTYIYERLQEYYERHLTYDTDIIKAFVGILKAFSAVTPNGKEIKAAHLYGIPIFYSGSSHVHQPTSSFLQGLAWKLSGNRGWVRQTQTTSTFPTWSWVSIKLDRLKDNPGRIAYSSIMQDIETTLPYDVAATQQDLHVYVHHPTLGRMTLDECTDFWMYCGECFPHVEVKSWTRVCNVHKGGAWKEDYGVVGFYKGDGSMFTKVSLDYPGTEPSGTVIMVYLGIYTRHYMQPIFLMVQASPVRSQLVGPAKGDVQPPGGGAEQRSYRRIGVYHGPSIPRSHRDWTMKDVLSHVSNGPGNPVDPNWRYRSLRLV